MDDSLIYVIAAFAITGLVIVIYLLTLSRQAQNVREEFEELSGEPSQRQPESTLTSQPRPTAPDQTRA